MRAVGLCVCECVRGVRYVRDASQGVHLVLDEHRRRALAHPHPLLAAGVDLVAREGGDAAAADDDAGARVRQNLVAEQPRRPSFGDEHARLVAVAQHAVARDLRGEMRGEIWR